MSLGFVNVNGDAIPEFVIANGLAGGRAPAKKRETPEKFHKGWRVVGVRLRDLVDAKAKTEKEAKEAIQLGREPKPWNEQQWLMNAKAKPIRSKPYEIPEAADLCKTLAEKTGDWLRIQVIEIKKGEA